MIVQGDNILLFIHPKKAASKEPVEDGITKAIRYLVKNKSDKICLVLKTDKGADIDLSGDMTMGTHKCTAGCDTRSKGYDMEIEIEGKKYYTNYLACHYVEYHREEVPEVDLELLRKVKVPEDMKEEKLETYYVCLYTYKSANVGGPKEKDPWGWRRGNYGCGDHLQVVVDCLISDSEGYTVEDEIDHYLPAALFVGKKERDKIVVPLKNKNGEIKNVILDLFQSNSCYGGTGADRFEEVFENIVVNRQSTCSPTAYKPECSKEEQERILKEFATKHF